jgi:co-chaperonin GroES (HSP10)
MSEMIKMQPLGDYILLQKVITEKKPGTILTLHEIETNDPVYKVISVGCEVNGESLANHICHNDLVYVSKYNTHPMKIDNQEFLLVKREHVLGFANG